jgi:hypothetical protein
MGLDTDFLICLSGSSARGNIPADTMLSAGLCDYPDMQCDIAL